MSVPKFEIVKTTRGATSIRNNIVGETMHNPIGPWKEACQLYVEQPKLEQRLRQHSCSDPYTIFDIGLGSGSNALAAIHAHQKLFAFQQCGPLRVISFEIDLSLLSFTIDHLSHFRELQYYQEALKQLLKTGYWREAGVEWLLREGDFNKLIDEEKYRADLIYFDAYSPKKNPDMWGYSTFSRIRNRCWDLPNRCCSLYTYSRSTPVRTALLAAGFFVGAGQATGEKDETTQAATIYQDLSHPLGGNWLDRWRRSSVPHPIDRQLHAEIDFSARVLKHPQFTGESG